MRQEDADTRILMAHKIKTNLTSVNTPEYPADSVVDLETELMTVLWRSNGSHEQVIANVFYPISPVDGANFARVSTHN